MKRYKLLFVLLFTLTGCVEVVKTNDKDYQEYGSDLVELESCIDGDTFWATLENGESIKVRLLLVDTPESTNQIEEYGKEASEFTCNLLETATEIKLEYDFEKLDKYGRTLAYVWLDDVLLQNELAKNGYVEKIYDYGDYRYEDEIKNNIVDSYGIYEY